MAVWTNNMTTPTNRRRSFVTQLGTFSYPLAVVHQRSDRIAFNTQAGKATVQFPNGVLQAAPMGNTIISPTTGRIA